MKDLSAIKQEALGQGIPIVRDQTIRYIARALLARGYKTVLEIGTGNGYSACVLLNTGRLTVLDTVEKQEARVQAARENLADWPAARVFRADAATFAPSRKYDLVFLDGSKARLVEQVERYLPFVAPGGTLFVDNVLLKKVVGSPWVEKSPSKRKMVKRMLAFQTYLAAQDALRVAVHEFDDGLAEIRPAK